MDDALHVGSAKSIGDLQGVANATSGGSGPLSGAPSMNSIDQIAGAGWQSAHVIERANMGMIQRRNRAGFALEAVAVFAVQGLDGDGATQARVGGRIDLAHAAHAKYRNDFIGAEFGPGLEAHRV